MVNVFPHNQHLLNIFNMFKYFNDPDVQLFIQVLKTRDGFFDNHLGRIAIIIDGKFVPFTFNTIADVRNTNYIGTILHIPCSKE